MSDKHQIFCCCLWKPQIFLVTRIFCCCPCKPTIFLVTKIFWYCPCKPQIFLVTEIFCCCPCKPQIFLVTKIFWALSRLSYWLALCGFSQLTLHAPPRMQIHLQPSCLFAHISLHNVQCVFYKYSPKMLQIFYKYISSQYGMHIAYSTKSDGNTFWIMIQVYS